ncbi:hypothetical protein D3C84_926560 [compost metagenome]
MSSCPSGKVLPLPASFDCSAASSLPSTASLLAAAFLSRFSASALVGDFSRDCWAYTLEKPEALSPATCGDFSG